MDNNISMGISVSNMEIRQCELYNRMDNITVKDKTSFQFKTVLRNIKQTANVLLSSRRRIQLLSSRFAATGAVPRDDARALAEADYIVLTDDQTRTDV